MGERIGDMNRIEEIRKRCKDNFQYWVASKLPKWLVMRATVRLAVYATTGKYSSTVVPELTVMEAIRRWSDEAGRD
jgi:hypothetical protein